MGTIFVDSLTAYSTTPKMALGTEREEGKGIYTYVYTADAIQANRAVNLESGVLDFTVIPTTVAPVVSGVSDWPYGFNETGDEVPASSYFWLMREGYGTIEGQTSGYISSARLYVATTSGTLAAITGVDSDRCYHIVAQSMAMPADEYLLNVPAYINVR